MSNTLLRSLTRGHGCCRLYGCICVSYKQTSIHLNKITVVNYSRRSDSKNFDLVFKIVKSKMRVGDTEDFLGIECGPNWELLSPRGNRFYFPNAVGPAWQGASSTITLEAPLESIVDFEGKASTETAMLQFSVNECPSLIKKSLHELFPTPEVMSSEKIALMTLSFSGDTEQGARKFVLAAREITTRLRLHGYWADFMNPFSGKPFYSWANGKNLYKVDDRFRGLNMKIFKVNDCVVISPDSAEQAFSGTIYTNAPTDYFQLRSIIDTQI
uniref:Methylmalonic aciduria and homocystinuria type D protein, mitochondrial n=1 Tax=Glossina austeni TaxID=7395 RepID=A0A1A9VNF9_GLOAU